MKKYSLFGVNYSATNYEEASALLIKKARDNQSYTCSALAVHGLIEACENEKFLQTIRNIDMVLPDGQPIKWALNSFYHLGLKDRVCGPDLTLHLLKKADTEKLKVYLYGSTAATLEKLESFISNNYKNITICGIHIDRFREATEEENIEDINKINNSGAHIVLVGRGCPRQEYWVNNQKGKINAVMLAVGAAFDFHAQTVKRAPRWMQKNGIEWLHRLCQDPKRLWKRYFKTNSTFIYLFLKFKIWGIKNV